MKSLLKWTLGIINDIHDVIIFELLKNGAHFTDRALHFWIFGLVGMVIFAATNAAFKFLARWGLSAVSFVFTVFVLTTMAIGLEVEQSITGRGSMELMDAIAGVAGFLILSVFYLMILTGWKWLRRLLQRTG